MSTGKGRRWLGSVGRWGHSGLRAAGLCDKGTRPCPAGAGAFSKHGSGLQVLARAADAGADAGSRYRHVRS